jgi:hypothetical protein
MKEVSAQRDGAADGQMSRALATSGPHTAICGREMSTSGLGGCGSRNGACGVPLVRTVRRPDTHHGSSWWRSLPVDGAGDAGATVVARIQPAAMRR